MEWAPVYHVKGWGKFKRHYGDFCTGADTDRDRPKIQGRVVGRKAHGLYSRF
jgi:hypothetical protein